MVNLNFLLVTDERIRALFLFYTTSCYERIIWYIEGGQETKEGQLTHILIRIMRITENGDVLYCRSINVEQCVRTRRKLRKWGPPVWSEFDIFASDTLVILKAESGSPDYRLDVRGFNRTRKFRCGVFRHQPRAA